MHFSPRPRGSAGMAAAEFLIAAIPLCLTGLSALEAARWQLARVSVRHALYEAARAGTTHHAAPGAIGMAFERALAPLAPRPVPGNRLPHWRIDILTPHAAHFDDFADPADRTARRLRVDYQAEQHAEALARGWPNGQGPQSGADVFAANTLTLRAIYLHPPLVPGLQAALRAWPGASADPLAHAGRRELGRLPISVDVALPMQSAAIEGPHSVPPASRPEPATDAAGNPQPPVTGGIEGAGTGQTNQPPAVISPGPQPEQAACIGWWCQPGRPDQPPDAWLPEPAAGDPACGVLLCCTP